MRTLKTLVAAFGLVFITMGATNAQQTANDPFAQMFNQFNPMTMMAMPGMAMPGYGAAPGMGGNPFQSMMVPGNWVNPNMYMQFMNPNTYMQMMNPATYMAMMNPAMYMQLMNPMAYMQLMNPASYMAWMNPVTYTQGLNAMMQMGHAEAGVPPADAGQENQ